MILIAESPSRRTEYRRYLGNAGFTLCYELVDDLFFGGSVDRQLEVRLFEFHDFSR